MHVSSSAIRTSTGKKKVKKASGLLARCIQHETDHLNGILFIEKAISLHKGPKDEE